MKKRLTGNAYSYIVVMAIALAVIVLGLGLPYFASKLLPIVLGSAILVLAGVGLGREVWAQAKATTTARVEAGEGQGSGKRYWVAVAWVGGFLLAIYLVGFLISMPLYIFSYMKMHKISWTTAVVSTIAVTGAMYFGFHYLGIELYRGLLFS